MALQLSSLQKQVINLDAKKVHKYMDEHPFNEVRYMYVREEGVCVCRGGGIANPIAFDDDLCLWV